MKCENCGSEKIKREITLITKMGLVPTISENDPLGFPAEMAEQRTAGWKGRLSCQECGAESEWYGDYLLLDKDVTCGSAAHDEAEMELLVQAHDTMRMVVIPTEKDVPELPRCKACGTLPVVDAETSKTRNEKLNDQIAEHGDE